MGKLASILFPTFALLALAAAKPALPASGAEPAPAGPLPGKAIAATPSRYASQDLTAYVEALAKQLAIGGRVCDPFCQSQDPDAKPVVRPTAAKAIRRVTTVEPPASLSDIVGRIEITTIMPRDKRFLVGSRSIGQGDKLPINFRNKQIHTQVTEVSSHKIVFRNLDTGELGVRQLNLLPVGMTPGTRNIAAPGMVPSNPNSPLEVDAIPATPATIPSP